MRRRLKVRLGRWEGVQERLGERMVMAERGLSMSTFMFLSMSVSTSMSMSTSRSVSIVATLPAAVLILSGDELAKGESWSSDRLRFRSILTDRLARAFVRGWRRGGWRWSRLVNHRHVATVRLPNCLLEVGSLGRCYGCVHM